jgi:hypothetical protein
MDRRPALNADDAQTYRAWMRTTAVLYGAVLAVGIALLAWHVKSLPSDIARVAPRAIENAARDSPLAAAGKRLAGDSGLGCPMRC